VPLAYPLALACPQLLARYLLLACPQALHVLVPLLLLDLQPRLPLIRQPCGAWAVMLLLLAALLLLLSQHQHQL
jgi:hypothetical protein